MTGPTGQPEQRMLSEWQNTLAAGEESKYPIRRFCMAAVAQLLINNNLVTDSDARCLKDSLSGSGGCHSNVSLAAGVVTVTASEAHKDRESPCLLVCQGRSNADNAFLIARLAELGISVAPPDLPPQAPLPA